MFEKVDWFKVTAAIIEKAEEIFSNEEPYKGKTRGGLGGVKIRNPKGDGIDVVYTLPFEKKLGDSDKTLLGKFKYVERTGKPSGAPEEELQADEAKWQGAVPYETAGLSMIFGFTGMRGEDDVRNSQAGIAELNRQLGK
ncbi:MAG: hypothetical protein LBD02_10135 [Christensenellaceae bacterium]|nr:hypothetical protein [Christensenellaceae bacterium]